MLPPFREIAGDFEVLDEWEDRYRYLIELGRLMPALPAEAHSEANKVQGCASQVWLEVTPTRRGDEDVLDLAGDSDAHIVKGLVALLISLMSGRSARDILATDALGEFEKLGLAQHLTPQRSNGLRSMVERVRSRAAERVASA
jgi:cysteine desulfuration protein SufE